MSVLASDEILKRLRNHEIFLDGTWEPKNIRGAAYDLRIASDFMRIPGEDGKYAKDMFRGDPVVLREGEVALFSSYERLCIPWDLTATIGIKFSFSRKGLIILSGLLVDPGFGLALEDGTWVPSSDERLHFIVANVSDRRISINPGKDGDSIATIQFSGLSGKADRIEVRSRVEVEKDFLLPGSEQLGLAFFTKLAAMEPQVVEAAKSLDDLKRSQQGLEEDGRELRQVVENVNSQTRTVVLFGVYLLLVTIIGLTLSTTMILLSEGSLEVHGWRGVALLVIAGSVLALYAALFIVVVVSHLRTASHSQPAAKDHRERP